ncbi:MAG: RDD family protein [Bacillota bacterium]|nr:RDD family protein [Bacillota bacterium]
MNNDFDQKQENLQVEEFEDKIELDQEELQTDQRSSIEELIKKEDQKAQREFKENLYYQDEFGKDHYPKELYAGFFRRLFAFVLDSIIASAFAGIFVNLILKFLNLDNYDLVEKILSTFFYLLYFTGSTYISGGQSLGKMIFNLKVVSLDGQKLSLAQVLTREFFGRFIHSFSFLFLLYILVGLTERKQSLSDILADTGVIDLSKEKAYIVGQIDQESYIYE